MPKFAPAAQRAETPASLEDVKRNVQAIIDAAEAIMPTLAKLQRDGKVMGHHGNHATLSRIEVVLHDAILALSTAVA